MFREMLICSIGAIVAILVRHAVGNPRARAGVGRPGVKTWAVSGKLPWEFVREFAWSEIQMERPIAGIQSSQEHAVETELQHASRSAAQSALPNYMRLRRLDHAGG